MKLIPFLQENGSPFTWKLNLFKIKTIHLPPTPEGAHTFNSIVDYIFWDEESWDTIERAKKGGASIKLGKLLPPMWDIEAGDTNIILTIIHEAGCARICFESDFSTKRSRYPISGRQALQKFSDVCATYDVDLSIYALPSEQSLPIKSSIPKYLIQLLPEAQTNITYINCHHIDFHSSFPAGLANTHPEFYAPINELYIARKTDEVKKAVLNLSIGMMQSRKWNNNAQHAQLAFDAITDNNKRVLELTQRLAENGRKPLLHNTDGIWYQGEIFHGDGEGSNLGQWQNDHTNCTFRIKSAGAYEYIENEQYFPVVRGYTNLDKIKSRDKWEWGDIFKDEASPYVFYWNGTYITHKDETPY